MKSNLLPLLLVFSLSACTAPVQAQPVVRHPDPSASLESRWSWAADEARSACESGCWTGYSIDRLMEENNWIGSWHRDGGSRATLEEVIYNRETPRQDRSDDPREAARQALERRGSKSESRRLVTKEVGILFRYAPGGRQITDVRVSNMSLSADLENLPVFWLGKAPQPESIALLIARFRRAGGDEAKEELVSAVGLHDASGASKDFLKDVLAGNEGEEVREQAAFWLAEQGGADVVRLLDQTARRDRSQEVREQAVFGLSRMEDIGAEDALIALARGEAGDRETREQAIFWLGQKASGRAAAELGDIAENDPETEVQKKAVFALSQLDDAEGVPRLIQLAKTHRNERIRQEAIFWLGQTGDPRAVDVLVEIVKGQ